MVKPQSDEFKVMGS